MSIKLSNCANENNQVLQHVLLSYLAMIDLAKSNNVSFIFIIWTYHMVQHIKTFTNKITGLQNKAVKLISNSKRTDKCSPIYKNLEILLSKIFIFLKLLGSMFQFCSKKLPRSFLQYFIRIPEIHSLNTRSNTSGLKYYIPRFQTKRLLRSIGYVGAKRNKIPDPFKNNNYNKFIKQLKTHLHNN